MLLRLLCFSTKKIAMLFFSSFGILLISAVAQPHLLIYHKGKIEK